MPDGKNEAKNSTMNLTIDMGNTRVKYAVFDGGTVVSDGCSEEFDEAVIVGGAAYRTVVSPVRRAVARAVFTLFVMDVRPAFGRPEDRRPTGTASEGGVCAAFCRSAAADG